MATIKEKGTIAFMSEVQSGMSQSGNPWYRQTIVVDVAGYNGSFRKVALQASGNIVGDLEKAQIGDKVEITYQVTAREYNGRWYNNVDLYKVDFPEASAPQIQTPVYPQNPQFPQNPQGGYPSAPVAPQTAPAHRARPAVKSQPMFPQNMPMDLQQDDLPPAFYQ